MAVYVPVRPRWNPRGVVINYVARGQLCVRSWPKSYHDANTASQRTQRGKMAQVCRMLPHVKALLAEGYTPQMKRNGRRIGSYHAAVASALREWFEDTPHGPRLATSRLRLTDGVAALPKGITLGRQGDTLRVSWSNALPWAGAKLLVAAREPNTDGWKSMVIPLRVGATGANLYLPAAWRKRELEAWAAFVGNSKRVRTLTYHATLPPPRGSASHNGGKRNTHSNATPNGGKSYSKTSATTSNGRAYLHTAKRRQTHPHPPSPASESNAPPAPLGTHSARPGLRAQYRRNTSHRSNGLYFSCAASLALRHSGHKPYT